MEFLIFIGILFAIFWFCVQLYFLVKVPQFLEEISKVLRLMCQLKEADIGKEDD